MSPEDMNDESHAKAEETQVVRKGPRKASEVIAETEERMRAEAADEIAALKAQLAEAKTRTEEANAAAQVLARESLADQLKAPSITEVPEDVDGAVTVNFVTNDMTILGKLWFQGEELTIAPGTKEWDELWDKKRNKSYLELTEDEQVLVWGERKFRPGKWAGQSYEDLLSNPELSPEERQELQTILNKRKSRSASPAAYTTSTSQKRSPVSYS